jgi:hypothetical protein
MADVSEILLEYVLSSFDVCFFNSAGLSGLGGEIDYWFKGGSIVAPLLSFATCLTFLAMRRLLASGGNCFFPAEL